MNHTIRHLLGLFLALGPFGITLLAIADDSFLFLPIGIDLLTVILAARHHNEIVIYAIAGGIGSTIGVFLLDLVCRKGGEKGLEKLVKPKLLQYLKRQMQSHAAIALVVSCLAPPPFPFGASIAVASAFQYPRHKLLGLVGVSRGVRFLLIGWAAVHFGRGILRIANSSAFLWMMGAFIAIYVIGSVASVVHWVHIARSK